MLFSIVGKGDKILEMSMPSVHCFSTMFQLYVACVFLTDGACMMTLNTVIAEIPVCWEVINGTQ